jgi:integrase
MSSIVKAIIEKNELDVLNKIKATHATVGVVKPRASYSPSDLKKLEEALCSVPITYYNKPRNDRFWIILIAILQGFRKTAIVDLKELHITIDEDSKLPCFDLTLDAAPTDKPRILSPIHPLLIRVGFIKWLEQTPTRDDNRKLFKDDPESFGQWWNGTKGIDSWNRTHITTDKKKTFHSFRHYFCSWTAEVGTSEKELDEMSGHSERYVGDDVRNIHYLERTRAGRMSETQKKSIKNGKMLLRDLDWQRLKARAEELFGLKSRKIKVSTSLPAAHDKSSGSTN